MKKLFSLLFILSLFVSNTYAQPSTNSCWKCIGADVGGGVGGGLIGGGFGGPIGAIIGGTIGIVTASIGAHNSYSEDPIIGGSTTGPRQLNYTASYGSDYSVLGEIHNEALGLLIQKNVGHTDYEEIYNLVLGLVTKKYEKASDFVPPAGFKEAIIKEVSKESKGLKAVRDKNLRTFMEEVLTDAENGAASNDIINRITQKEKEYDEKSSMEELLQLTTLKNSYIFWTN